MLRKIMLVLAFISVTILGACSGDVTYTDVSTEEAKKLVEEGKVQVIDVRTPEEYAAGHIPGATLLPLQELEGRLNELKEDGAYLIVCQSGNRSTQASEILVKNGFSGIHNMTGGMGAWTGEVEQ